MHFADKAGLDVEKVIGVISKGAAQSWQMENRWKTMDEGKFDFGFAVDWMRKDLVDLHRRGAAATAPSLPVTALVDQFYARGPGDGRRPLGHLEPPQAPDALDFPTFPPRILPP